MPIIRMGPRLVYFAHVPKCAGTSVEDYLANRFGPLGFLDRQYLSVAPDQRWSKSSPQHIDWAALMRLFPPGFFASTFAVVRHPVSRAISAYRFQVEVEKTADAGLSFGDWLQAEAEARTREPYRSDNHSRPQRDFLPPEDDMPCAVFHLEHGLDALVPYFDMLAGDSTGPRALSHANKAGHGGAGQGLEPEPDDLALVAELYAADFARFGYVPDQSAPLAPPPKLDPAVLAAAEAARARAARPLNRLAIKARRRLRKWQS